MAEGNEQQYTLRKSWNAFIGEKTPWNYFFWSVIFIMVVIVTKELVSPTWMLEWSVPEWGSVTVDPVLGLAVGLVAGFMGGAVGAFISLFSVPLYSIWLGLPVKIAIGTNSLASACIGLFAAWVHFRKGTPNLKIAVPMMISGLIAAGVGAYISLSIEPSTLKMYFSAVVFGAAIWLLYRAIKPKEFKGAAWVQKAEKDGKKLPVPVAEGEFNGQKYKCDILSPAVGNFFIAILAGLMGVGGGFIFTPMLHAAFGLPMVVAVGTGNFVKVANIGSQFVVRGIADTVVYALAAFALFGGYFGAHLGRRLSLAVSPSVLRIIFGIALFYVGLKFVGIV